MNSQNSNVTFISPPNQSCSKAFNIFSLGRNRLLNSELCDISLAVNTRASNRDSDLDYFSPQGQYHSFRGNSLSTDSLTDTVDVELLNCTSPDTMFVRGMNLQTGNNYYSGCLIENLWPIRDSRFIAVNEVDGSITLRLRLWNAVLFDWLSRASVLQPNVIKIANPKIVLGNSNSFFWIPLVQMNINLTNGILINLTRNEMLSFKVVDQKLCLVATCNNCNNCDDSSSPSSPSPPIPDDWNLQSDWFGLLRFGASPFTDPNGKLSEPCSEGDVVVRLPISDILVFITPFTTYLGIEELFFRVINIDDVGSGFIRLDKPVPRNFPANFPIRIIHCSTSYEGMLNSSLSELCSAICPSTATTTTTTIASSPLPSSFSCSSHENLNKTICSTTSLNQFLSSGMSSLPNNYNLRWKGEGFASGTEGGGLTTMSSSSSSSFASPYPRLCSNKTQNLLLMALHTITLPNLHVKCENSETRLSSFPVLLIDVNDSQTNNVRFKSSVLNNVGRIGNTFTFVAHSDSEMGSKRLFVKYVGDFISKPIPLDIECRNLNISIRNANDGRVIRFVEQDTVPPSPPLPRMQWTIEFRISSERCG